MRYRNTEIEIEVDAPGGGILVLNDVWHPWWRASVDGKPAEILKANVLFRAVVVPPGKHVVRFSFHPFAGALAELKDKLSGAALTSLVRTTDAGGRRLLERAQLHEAPGLPGKHREGEVAPIASGVERDGADRGFELP